MLLSADMACSFLSHTIGVSSIVGWLCIHQYICPIHQSMHDCKFKIHTIMRRPLLLKRFISAFSLKHKRYLNGFRIRVRRNSSWSQSFQCFYKYWVILTATSGMRWSLQYVCIHPCQHQENLIRSHGVLLVNVGSITNRFNITNCVLKTLPKRIISN